MRARRQFTLVLIAALVLSLVTATQWVFAQTNTMDTEASLRIVGRVEAVTDGSLLVNGRAISTMNATLDANTELTVGANVMIDATLTAEGVVQATSITSADADFLLPDELRITGVLQNSSAGSFNLGGSLVDTVNVDLNGSLDTGSVVRVFADAEGMDWTARRVQVLDGSTADLSANTDLDLDLLSQGSYQIIGTLDAMDSGRIIISGVPIDTTNASIQSPLITGTLVNVWLKSTFEGFSAAQVSNVTIDADVDTSAFVDVDASAAETDASTSTETDAHVDANADTSASAEVGTDDTSAGVNIDLGGDVNLNLGG